MAVTLSLFAGAGAQFFDNNGNPLAGGKLYTYAAGTTTPQVTYTTSAGNVAHTNPIVLDSAGRVPVGGEIWLTDAVNYKFVLATSLDVTLGTYDNVSGNGSGIAASIFAALAAPSGSALVGFLQAGAGAVARTAQAKMREVESVNDRGTGNAALTAALADAAARPYPGGIINFPDRQYTYTGDFIMSRETRLDFGTSAISATPTNRFMNVGWGTVVNCGRPQFFGGIIDLYGANTTAFAMQNTGSVTIRDMSVNLRSAAQTAFHIKANGVPNAPYYGLIDGVGVRGTGAPSQIGFILEGLPVPGSITVNRWHINNITDCAAMGGGFDIRGADGLVLNNINLESLSSFAIRFGQGNRSYSGTVTTPGAVSSTFIDTGLIGSDLDQAATIIINSGPNIYESTRIVSFNPITGEVVLPFLMPYLFTVGNTYTLTEAKARSVVCKNVTTETGTPVQAAYVFTAGALACHVEPVFHTQTGGNIMTRAVEDLTNTCAVRYETYQFEGQLTTGSGIEWLIPNFTASNQGGVGLSSGGWIDAVTVTGSVRTLASLSPGEIDVEVFVNGTSEGLVAKLTTQSPTFARRIRTALTNSDFTVSGQNIMVRCNKSSMAIAEYVTVVVHVGYLG